METISFCDGTYPSLNKANLFPALHSLHGHIWYAIVRHGQWHAMQVPDRNMAMGDHPSGEGGRVWYLLLGIGDPEGDTSPYIVTPGSVQTVMWGACISNKAKHMLIYWLGLQAQRD